MTGLTATLERPSRRAQADGRVYDSEGSELGAHPAAMDNPSSLDITGRLLAVILLVLANGFFVATEFALVAVRRTRIEELAAQGHPLAPAVLRVVSRLDAFLAACQLGITLASLGLGWIGEPALAALIEPRLHFLPDNWAFLSAHALAGIIAFAIITVLHIVIGELAPKSLAIQRPDGTALAVARPIELFLFLFKPAIVVLNGLGNLLVRALGLQPMREEERVHSVEELRYLVSASGAAGLMGTEAKEIVERAFEFDVPARYVMVPRTEMACVPIEASLDDALAVGVKHHHTRLPVYTGDLDHIEGIVHLVEVLAATQAEPPPTLRDIVQPALLVPETIHAGTLLTRMQNERVQIAILMEEYGSTAGLVTLHDLVERLVGPVLDTQEVAPDAIETLPNGDSLIGGLALVQDLNAHFGLQIEDDEFDTVGGLLLARLGRIPAPGDRLPIGRYVLRVESLDGNRVELVRLLRPGHNRQSDSEAETGATPEDGEQCP